MTEPYDAPKADAAAGGMSPLEMAAFISGLRDKYADGYERERANLVEAVEDLKFRAGEQWPASVKAEREADGRPMLTINRMGQFVRQVTGDIRQNRPSIKVRPVDDGADQALAETLEGIIRHIEQASDAQAAYINAAESAAVCGYGAFRVTTDYCDDASFDQDICIRPIPNPLSVIWDPAAVLLDRSDANWCFVTELLPEDEYERRYPGKAKVEFEGETPENMSLWREGENVRIAEYWCKEPVEKTLALLDDGKTVDVSAVPKGVRPTRTRTVAATKVVQYIVSGTDILEGPTEWAGRHIPIIPVFGEEVNVGDRIVRHGVVRFARDSQRLLNYSRTAAAEAIALAPKQPWLVTAAMIAKNKLKWRNSNRRNDSVLEYEADPKAPALRPERVRPADPPQALWNEATLAAEDMYAVTGIYPASLGAKSNETSGRAILARQKEGDTGTFVYADNLARAIRRCGTVILDLIPRIYDTTRVVRILGEDDSHGFALLNAPMGAGQGYGTHVQKPGESKASLIGATLDAGRYDVQIVTGPSYATKRMEASDSMLAFLQAMPNAGPLIGDLVAKAQDWPLADKIAQRMRRQAVQAGVEEPNPQDPAEMQMAQARQAGPPDPSMVKAQADVAREHIRSELAVILQHMRNASAEEVARIAKGADDGLRAYEAELSSASAAYTADASADAQMHGHLAGAITDMHATNAAAAAPAAPAGPGGPPPNSTGAPGPTP